MSGAALLEPEERVEGRLKVTGQAAYTADLRPEGMLWARYALSPHPHARILSIDAAAARQVPGVRAILTGADIGAVRMGRALMDWPALAVERVRFVGERVAAVAAETPQAAEAAASAIRVEYEELPALVDPSLALAADAPILHPEAASYTFLPGTRAPVPHPNVQGLVTVRKGVEDIEQAFASAARVFEHVFRTPRQATGYMEPHAALVWIDAADVVHVVCTNKAPFVLRRQLAVATGLAPEQIVVEPTYIGGDFGGKGLSLDELGAYYLARATGRPIRSMLPYGEDMQASTTRHASTLRLRTAVDADARFVAHHAEVLLDGGAYAAGKALPPLVPIGALGTLGPYFVPNTSVSLTVVYTNTVPGGHMRAPGEVQAQFAGESHVDMIARDLGIDPLEFRLLNALRPGQAGPANEHYREVRAVEVLQALRDGARPPRESSLPAERQPAVQGERSGLPASGAHTSSQAASAPVPGVSGLGDEALSAGSSEAASAPVAGVSGITDDALSGRSSGAQRPLASGAPEAHDGSTRSSGASSEPQRPLASRAQTPSTLASAPPAHHEPGAINPPTPATGPRLLGRGISLAVRGIFQAPTSIRLRLDSDGHVSLLTGVPEQGSGMHTMLRRVAAATLDIDPTSIRLVRGSTTEAPFDPGASASWVTTIAGQAAARGAAELKTRLQELAAELRGWPAAEVELVDNAFAVASTAERVPFLELAAQIARGDEVVVDGTFEAPPVGAEMDANFAAYLAEVEVDAETGAIDVRHVLLAMDVGAIINPIAHQGQLDGSLLFGVGTALMEELVVADGRPLNANLADYKLPTQLDMPNFTTLLLPTELGPGPFGVKAAGEVANSAVAPAIANAVADAVGARVLELPLTAERVRAALRSRLT